MKLCTPEGKPVRKWFFVLALFVLTLGCFQWEAAEASPIINTVDVSGWISPGQDLTSAYVAYSYFSSLTGRAVAIHPLGDLAAGKNAFTFGIQGDGDLEVDYYTVLGIYDHAEGVTVGMDRKAADYAVSNGLEWEQVFGSENGSGIPGYSETRVAGFLAGGDLEGISAFVNSFAGLSNGSGDSYFAHFGEKTSLVDYSVASFHTPIPAAWWLLGSGLLGLFCYRRKF